MIRILAVSSEKRLNDPVLMDVATFKEQGVDVVLTTFYGIGTPKLMPKDIKEKLTCGLIAIANDPVFQAHIANLGITVDYLGLFKRFLFKKN